MFPNICTAKEILLVTQSRERERSHLRLESDSYLHADNSIDEKEHGNEQTDVGKSLIENDANQLESATKSTLNDCMNVHSKIRIV